MMSCNFPDFSIVKRVNGTDPERCTGVDCIILSQKNGTEIAKIGKHSGPHDTDSVIDDSEEIIGIYANRGSYSNY